MATFVLITGAFHGAWMWEKLTPLLEGAGHNVIAPDLPGMGADTSIAAADITLDHWGEAVADVVRRAADPVILAGHSRGGLVIGEAAERVAERLAGLIYITALVVPPGKSVRELVGADINAEARAPGLDRGVAAIGSEVAIPMFYNRCTTEDAAWAAAQLCPEPMLPMATPAKVTWERWGRVPRAFIECGDDRTLSIERQHILQAAAPCDPVIRLDTDHSPFLSAPAELAAAMIDIAAAFAGRTAQSIEP